MNRDQYQACSDLLVRHWQEQTRLEALPPDLLPDSRAEAYAVQACIERKSAAPLFGWKIAATSVAGQRHIGVDGPLAGRLLAERVIADGGACGQEQANTGKYCDDFARCVGGRCTFVDPAQCK